MASRFFQRDRSGRRIQVVTGKLDAERALRFGGWLISYEHGRLRLEYGGGDARVLIGPIDGSRAAFEAVTNGEVLASQQPVPLIVTGQGEYAEATYGNEDEQLADAQDQAAGLRKLMTARARG